MLRRSAHLRQPAAAAAARESELDPEPRRRRSAVTKGKSLRRRAWAAAGSRSGGGACLVARVGAVRGDEGEVVAFQLVLHGARVHLGRPAIHKRAERSLGRLAPQPPIRRG